jgi:hypothetical protein
MRKLMIVGLLSLALACAAPFGADARNGSGGGGQGGGSGGQFTCNEVVYCAGGFGGGFGGRDVDSGGGGGGGACVTPPGTGDTECHGRS